MTDNLHFALDGAWQVLLASLVFGAGLPVVYAAGIRSFAWSRPVGNVLGGLCVLVVLAGVALGITIIAAAGFGKAVSFEHGYPTIVAKE